MERGVAAAAADRKAIVRAFGEAWARRDLDAVMGFFADDCAYCASVGPEPGATFRGRAAVRAGVERMFRHDGDSVVEPGSIFAEGDRVFAEWRYRFPGHEWRPPVHGCDVFEFTGNRISRKDAFRKQLAPPPPPAADPKPGMHEPYRPRRFESLGEWAFGARRFKLIGITHCLRERPFAGQPGTVAAARSFVERLVPELDGQGGHFDLGFVILHHGEAANWLLFDWWVEGGVACQVLCRSTLEEPMVFERVSRPFLACVWEMVAIGHERNAWVEAMMGAAPDPERYVRSRIPSGLR